MTTSLPDRELLDSEIEARYGRLLAEGVAAFRVQPDYLVTVAEAAALAEPRAEAIRRAQFAKEEQSAEALRLEQERVAKFDRLEPQREKARKKIAAQRRIETARLSNLRQNEAKERCANDAGSQVSMTREERRDRILKLSAEGLAQAQIAIEVDQSVSTVHKTIARFRQESVSEAS